MVGTPASTGRSSPCRREPAPFAASPNASAARGRGSDPSATSAPTADPTATARSRSRPSCPSRSARPPALVRGFRDGFSTDFELDGESSHRFADFVDDAHLQRGDEPGGPWQERDVEHVILLWPRLGAPATSSRTSISTKRKSSASAGRTSSSAAPKPTNCAGSNAELNRAPWRARRFRIVRVLGFGVRARRRRRPRRRRGGTSGRRRSTPAAFPKRSRASPVLFPSRRGSS